jgi:hypothetical protein
MTMVRLIVLVQLPMLATAALAATPVDSARAPRRLEETPAPLAMGGSVILKVTTSIGTCSITAMIVYSCIYVSTCMPIGTD